MSQSPLVTCALCASMSRPVKWARFVSWTVTTPVLLAQMGGVGQLKWGSFNMNTGMIAADLVMILAGVTAQMTPNPALKWSLYFFGCLCMLLVFRVIWQIMWPAIHKFNAASRAGRPRDFEEQDKADPRCPWRIQKQTVFNLKAVMVCDCQCLPVRGAHTWCPLLIVIAIHRLSSTSRGRHFPSTFCLATRPRWVVGQTIEHLLVEDNWPACYSVSY